MSDSSKIPSTLPQTPALEFLQDAMKTECIWEMPDSHPSRDWQGCGLGTTQKTLISSPGVSGGRSLGKGTLIT